MPHHVERREDGTSQLVEEPGQELAGFELPFPVATLADVNQRAYICADGTPEWLFSRVHSYCQIGSEPGRMLRVNQASIALEHERLQVDKGQFHYRGATPEEHARKWSDHTMESHSLLVILIWFMNNKALAKSAKVRALALLLDLAAKAFTVADLHVPMMGLITRPDGTVVGKELAFNQQTLCPQWARLINELPGAMVVWKGLGARTWMNRCIASAPETATFGDIWLYMCYLACHPKLKKLGTCLWLHFGKLFLPVLLNATGRWLATLALNASNEALQMLPVLRKKSGNARRLADPVNKLLLLWKLRKEKQHRAQTAQTHSDLGASNSRMIHWESYLDCLLHLKAVQAGLGDHGGRACQLSVTWDPSTYGGKEIFIGIVYDWQKNLASYLMAQQLGHTMLSELDQSLLECARRRVLTRLDGYKELKGLSCALQSSIGVNLMDFKVPQGLHCRPLTEGEFRLEGPNGKYIVKQGGGDPVPEVPEHIDLGQLPCLVSISDQGPSNMASINYVLFSQQALLFWAIYDPFHRAWNDLKLAMKRVPFNAWRVVLELTCVANINYGPFGSSAWFFKKKAKLEDFLASNDCTCEAWQRYQHLIAQERRQAEPAGFAASQELFQSLHCLDSFTKKGPLIKLMRWFSFFESMLFHQGELYCTKMVLEHSMGIEEPGSEAEVEVEEWPKTKDDRKELQELKKRKGTWKLAPQLINSRSLCIKDIILSVGKATWQHFSERARNIVTPNHVLEHNIACDKENFWMAELLEMVHTSLYDSRHLQHLLPQFRGHDQALQWHCDLLNELLEARSRSLAAFHCMPPNIYHKLLFPLPHVARGAHDKALRHFKILLEAEEAALGGAVVKPLDVMYWRLNPLIRCLYLAFEQDERTYSFFTEQSAAHKLLRPMAQHLGDSRVIENVHQHGRDIFRASKANSISNTAIMANVLRSGVLEGRQVPMVKANEYEKAIGPVNVRKEGVRASLRTTSKTLPKEIQQLMMPKKGGHTWPSPSPAALFPSAAATQWLFHFWAAKPQGIGVNEAWVTCLARPGALIAQRSAGLMIKVLSSAEFGLLGLAVRVEVLPGGDRCSC